MARFAPWISGQLFVVGSNFEILRFQFHRPAKMPLCQSLATGFPVQDSQVNVDDLALGNLFVSGHQEVLGVFEVVPDQGLAAVIAEGDGGTNPRWTQSSWP